MCFYEDQPQKGLDNDPRAGASCWGMLVDRANRTRAESSADTASLMEVGECADGDERPHGR